MLGLRVKYVMDIIKLGTSNFINHAIMMAVNIVLNNMLIHYGALSVYGSDIPLAVSGVSAKLNMILGFNMGAKKYDRVKETYKKAVTAALVISVLAFIVFQLFPRQLTGIFGTGDELYFEFAERYLRIYMFMVCILGIQPISVNYFTSTGNVRQGILLSLSRQGFFLIPLLIVLPIFFGLNGVLFAGPIADFLACVLSLVMVCRNFKKLTQIENGF